MKIALDSNIFIDLVFGSRPGHEEAMAIAEEIERQNGEIYIFSDSVAVAEYISIKEKSHPAFLTALEAVMNIDFFHIAKMEKEDYKTALENATAAVDVEDLSKVAFVERTGCDFFVTNDRGLLELGDSKIVSSAELLRVLSRGEESESERRERAFRIYENFIDEALAAADPKEIDRLAAKAIDEVNEIGTTAQVALKIAAAAKKFKSKLRR